MSSDLFLIHGWNMPSSIWERLESNLTSDFRVVRAVLPGYGESTDDLDPQLPLDQLVQQQLDSLLNQAPSSSVWCGWSLGATLALAAALAESELPLVEQRIAGLVLMAPTPCFLTKPDWELGIDQATFDQLLRLIRRRYQSGTKQFLKLQLPTSECFEKAYPNLSCQPPPSDNALVAGYRLLCEWDCRRQLDRLEIPTLVIAAQTDQIVPPAASHWLAGQLPLATLVTIGDGHLFPLLAADGLGSEISEFVQRIQPGA